jgi:hypothetical protein
MDNPAPETAQRRKGRTPGTAARLLASASMKTQKGGEIGRRT